MHQETEICVGCGATVPRVTGPIHRYMTSAPGCWEMFGRVNACMHSGAHPRTNWQLCVDAFAVQHPGSPSPPAIRSVAIHLLSLFSQLVAEDSGAARNMMTLAAEKQHRYHWLTPPSFAGCRTVGHLLGNLSDAPRAAEEWAMDSWHAWRPHHAQIAAWYAVLRSGGRI